MPAIRAWLENAEELGLPSGPSKEEFFRRAADLVERLRTSTRRDPAGELGNDTETLDVLYAATELLDRGRNTESREDLADIGHVYEFVSTISLVDEFSEKAWMLARLAFLAWNQCRLAEDYPAAQVWQRRCTQHTLEQEHVRDFMAIPPRNRSRDLNERYLTDECVLLTAYDRLEYRRNMRPADGEQEGEALYEWIDSRAIDAGLDSELVHYLAASAALLTLGAKLGMQHRKNLPTWFDRVDSHIAKCRGSGPLLAILDHRHITNLYMEGSYSPALNGIDPLMFKFEQLGMEENALKARYLKGLILKETRQFERALCVFSEVRAQAGAEDVLGLASLAISNSAQILGSQGQFTEALRLANEAYRIAQESGSAFGVALAQASVGELLRDHGDLEASIAAYVTSAVSYETAGMAGLAAYLRVVIAETLVLAGRSRQAVSEVLAALPIIESHWLTQEAVAAISILREAIERQQANPEALRQLREQLQLMREDGKL